MCNRFVVQQIYKSTKGNNTSSIRILYSLDFRVVQLLVSLIACLAEGQIQISKLETEQIYVNFYFFIKSYLSCKSCFL